MRPPDAAFADPEQAVLYDVFHPDRSDLELYLSIVEEVEADTVVDVGCGTGALAVRLAERGKTVVGLDPAAASVSVARSKRHADRVQWIVGDANALRGTVTGMDLAVMTGNVAQVFVDDEDWHETLASVRSSLRRDGWFVFETRRPEARAWEKWDVAPTDVVLPDGRKATVSRSVTVVDPPLVTFEGSMEIDGNMLRSRSTLRFRDHAQIEDDLARHGLEVVNVRDAPDRPGQELVFLTRASDTAVTR